MKLIIPMAGRGTRVRPHSHVTPKPLLPVVGKSMVERIVDTFNRVLPRHLDAGIFVLGPDFGESVRRQLAEICARHEMQAHFVVQEVALGTGHAVFAAEPFLNGEGIVVFADTLFDMAGDVDLDRSDVLAWVKEVDDPSRFGVAVREGGRVVALVEKPKTLISNEALIGIYYVRALEHLRDAVAYLIEHDIRGHGEYQLTDAMDKMLKDGLKFETTSVTEWLDCGTIAALMDTTKIILGKEQSDLRRGTVEGSVIREPVYIGPGARVVDAVVGPNVSIEEGAEVRGAVVRESIIFGGARVSNAVLSESLIGRHAEVSDMAGRINVGDHSVVSGR